MNCLRIALPALVLWFAAFKSGAIIDAALQMQLGNPTGATADPNNHQHYLIQRTVEAIDYSDANGQPNWACWDVTSSDVGSSGRTDAWAVDTSLPSGFNPIPINTYGSIAGQSYDRGHMCPSADRTDTVADNELVFIMSNIIPQASAQNQGVWANFETYCRGLLSSQELLIMCGPYNFGPNRLDSGLVGVASNLWKIVVCVPLGSGTALSRITNANPNSIRVIALEIPNTDAVGGSSWNTFATSVKQVQNDTGYNFFSALPNNLAWVLRSKVDGQAPAAPGSISFSPPSGAAGTIITLTGTSLDTVTNVTFNAAAASYTILSPTQISALVPANATSGAITVRGLGGNAASPASFTVTTTPTVDLAITGSHNGNFTQGDASDTYTLIVTNIGSAASSGMVTVTDALPVGLTATAISGSGWTADLATLTCTRSDALAAGSAFTPITITVSVSATAPASVTNTATVAGGTDANSANNTASDPTTVLPALAPLATTGTATAVGTTTATLNGTVNPNGQPTFVQFQYGLTTAYGSTAALSGNLTGTSAQAVSANITGLAPSTTYHFRVSATNTLGVTSGLDTSFTTLAAGVVDLAITASHNSSFTQGDIGDTYTLTVTNSGMAASSGLVTVTDTLPAGLTATGIAGSGWTANLATLTCTRSDALAAGSAYPPITLTVNVSANAPASVTNSAALAGGGDANLANNTANDVTAINASGGTISSTTLVGWDVSGLPGGTDNFGPSPLSPTTNASTLTVLGLTRGSGVGTTGSGAQRGWGGNNFTNTTSAAAIAANRFMTFGVAAKTGYKVSYSSVSKFDYRHSATGPTNGLLQYQIGTGAFADIATFSYPSNTSAGGSLSAIDLSGIPALQNVGAGTNVTFRIVNWGGTSSAGTWYIFDVANSAAPDFVVQGVVSPAVSPMADLAVSACHGASFTQGDTGAAYTINVTNAGTAATTGTVNITDVLPAGLAATAISGNGWTANLATLTCVRSDSLAPGASYPPVTVMVSVSTNAPASVTNLVTVSGGGEANTANNSAADPTAIIPLAPVQAWRLKWFGTSANSGPAADTAVATSDGMPNLLKYALDLNPLVAATNPVTGDIATGHLRLTCPKNPNATDITFLVELTSDLTLPAWTTSGATVDQDTSTLLQVHDNTEVGAEAKRFIRLHVTRP